LGNRDLDAGPADQRRFPAPGAVADGPRDGFVEQAAPGRGTPIGQPARRHVLLQADASRFRPARLRYSKRRSVPVMATTSVVASRIATRRACASSACLRSMAAARMWATAWMKWLSSGVNWWGRVVCAVSTPNGRRAPGMIVLMPLTDRPSGAAS